MSKSKLGRATHSDANTGVQLVYDPAFVERVTPEQMAGLWLHECLLAVENRCKSPTQQHPHGTHFHDPKNPQCDRSMPARKPRNSVQVFPTHVDLLQTELDALREHEWDWQEDLKHVFCATCGARHLATSKRKRVHRIGCAFRSLLVKLGAAR